MGELARKPGCPELAATPLELFTPRPGEGYSFIDMWSWPVLGAVSGVLSAFCRNFVMYRPVWAGIHTHILAGGIFAYAAVLVRDSRYAAKAEADEVYKHYITLHPEDFPPFERKRYRDVYKPFDPAR